MFLKRKLSYLKRRFGLNAIILTLIPLILFSALIFFFCPRPQPQQLKSANAQNVQNTEAVVVENSFDDEVNLLKKPMTILLLGLDSRRGDQKPRCDAIHLITFSPPEDKIIITSVPRGTHVDLDEVATASAYLGNSCHIKGIDFAVVEITKITNLDPDYIVKINFSQTLGILRLLGMPTTPTLQFLRNRKSYLKGDYQRSHNQALFLKDMILSHSQQAAGLPMLMKQILFKIVETDNLDFETANSIFNWVVKNNFWRKSEKIELVIKPTPFYKIIDVHFAASDYPTEDSWQNDEEFETYQEDLKSYLKNLLEKGEEYLTNNQKKSLYQLLSTPFSQQLWLQLENDQLRNQFHFDLLRLYVLSSDDKNEASLLLQDFIAEMEIVKEAELKNKAEELLAFPPKEGV